MVVGLNWGQCLNSVENGKDAKDLSLGLQK